MTVRGSFLVMQNAVVFVLNNHKFPRWLYGYESGATKQQREMLHCFRAYVFRLLPSDNDQDDATSGWRAVVLAHHASTSFTLVSYRRTSDLRVRSAEVDAVAAANEDADVKMDASTHDDAENVGENQEDTAAVDDFEHRWISSTRHQATDMKTKVQHLWVLQFVITRLPLKTFSFYFTKIEEDLRRLWLQFVLVNASPVVFERSMARFSLAQVVGKGVVNEDALDPRWRPVVTTCANLLVQVFGSPAVKLVLRSTFGADAFARRRSLNVPGRAELASAFERFVELVYHALNQSLTRINSGSLAALVDDVTSMIYSEAGLEHLRRPVLDILRGEGTDSLLSALFQSFTAQILESHVNYSRGIPPNLAWRLSTGAAAVTAFSAWNGRWLLDMQSVQNVDQEVESPLLAATIEQIMYWLHQLLAFELTFGASGCSIKSAVAASTWMADAASMNLVLDGESRVFRAFPTGLASMVELNGWNTGDYVGTMATSKREVELTFFAFRANAISATRIRRVAANLKLGEPNQVDIAVVLEDAVCGSTGLAEMLCSVRHALWKQLDWTQIAKLKARYDRVAER